MAYLILPRIYSGPKSAYNLLQVVKKSEVRKVADKTFDACKSAGVKKLRVRAAESYAGLSKNKILQVRIEQVQIDLINLSSQRVECEGKVYRYVLLVMDVFSRFHWLSPLQRKFPHYVAEQLFKIFPEHGSPDRVQRDNGGEFKKDVKKVYVL